LKPFEITKIMQEKLEGIRKVELTYEEAGLKRPEEKKGVKYKREKESREQKRKEREARGEVVVRKNKKSKKKDKNASNAD
jgi:hypothetical protein